jgi:hypothetical protein
VKEFPQCSHRGWGGGDGDRAGIVDSTKVVLGGGGSCKRGKGIGDVFQETGQKGNE